MASSVVVSARRRLVEILRPVLSGVAVHYAHPGEDNLGHEAVWLETSSAEVEPSQHRATKIRRKEQILQTLRIAVLGAGLTQEAADARCVEIFAAIDTELAKAANVALTGATGTDQQVFSCTVVSWLLFAEPQDVNHVAGMRVVLAIEAQSL